MINIILIVILAIALFALVENYKFRFYLERACMFFGYCPRCKHFSINHIKGYPVCSGCGKR